VVKLDDGTELRVQHPGDWEVGGKVELVVRAQKVEIAARERNSSGPEMNRFLGKIKERSYMGGEVSYFVELGNQTILHVINMSKAQPLQEGQEVSVRVPPEQCGLLSKEEGSTALR
jgi:ABC-type Fe3+/spermidine/putrescine transport system ATPase subunit